MIARLGPRGDTRRDRHGSRLAGSDCERPRTKTEPRGSRAWPRVLSDDPRLATQIERELQYLEPLEPAPDPVLTPEQVEPVAMAPIEPLEPQWDEPVEVAVDADPMPSATFAEPDEAGYGEPSSGLDEVGDDPVFDA